MITDGKVTSFNEAVVVSIVVTTTLWVNSYPTMYRNTDATTKDAKIVNAHINFPGVYSDRAICWHPCRLVDEQKSLNVTLPRVDDIGASAA